MSKYNLVGTWTKAQDGHESSISEAEALRLISPHTASWVVDPLAHLRDNPWGKTRLAEGGTLHFEPNIEKVLSALDGGYTVPVTPDAKPLDIANQLLDIVRRYAPLTFINAQDRLDLHEAGEVELDLDAFNGDLMEQLDTLAPAELSFTARTGADEITQELGFWPTDTEVLP